MESWTAPSKGSKLFGKQKVRLSIVLKVVGSGEDALFCY